MALWPEKTMWSDLPESQLQMITASRQIVLALQTRHWSEKAMRPDPPVPMKNTLLRALISSTVRHMAMDHQAAPITQ